MPPTPGDAAAPAEHNHERFVWPPRPISPRPSAESESAPTPPRSSDLPARPPTFAKPAGLWGRIEEVWLGLTTPPMAARAAAAGWMPDHPAAYCPRCGTTVGLHEADAAGCRACSGKKIPWDRFVRVGSYEGLLRQMIVEVKFTRWRRLGHELGGLLGTQIAQLLAAERVDPAAAVIVPMPTSFRRRLTRGIDHALVIARGVSEASGIPINRALDRLHRPSQRSVAPSRRRANVAGSLQLRPGSGLASGTLIIVDDVRTTGATMAAACRAIRAGLGRPTSKAEPLHLWAAVLGVTPEPGTGPAARPSAPQAVS